MNDVVRSDTERVLPEDVTITVPSGFFDELLVALNAPATLNENLAKAFRRSRRVVKRR